MLPARQTLSHEPGEVKRRSVEIVTNLLFAIEKQRIGKGAASSRARAAPVTGLRHCLGDGVGVGSIGVGDGVALGDPSGVGEGVPVGPSGDPVGDGCGFTSLHVALHAANAALHSALFAFSGLRHAWYCTSQSF